MPVSSVNRRHYSFVTLGAVVYFIWISTTAAAQDLNQEYASPCCSFPCQNGGICLTQGYDGFTCDCTATGYHGDYCDRASFFKRALSWLRPDKEVLQYIMTHFSWFWVIINKISPLQRAIMKYIYTSRGAMVESPPRYTSDHEYITMDAYYNVSYYARSLPPVPKNCPTPMGVTGPKELPDADEIMDKFFRRTKFIPEPHRSNVLFSNYAQHFTHQFFKTDFKMGPGFTWGGHGVDLTHVYGKDPGVQKTLRSFKDGKMLTQVINGEEFPPLLKDAPIPMNYPPGVPEERKFALGHPFFALLPGLFAYGTIWLREHNRVCDILRREHPEWEDEQLFQTARLILVGETIKITIEDYVQHLSQYKFRLTFDPELTHGTSFQFSNRIFLEFNHLYHWHPLTPDFHNVSSTIYPLPKVLYNVESVLKHGLTEFVESMVKQRAGKLSHHNHSPILVPIIKSALLHGRTLRLQSFNNYRKHFALQPYTSFQHLTGETEMAAELERMYGSVDAVEFLVGLFVERDGYTVTPKTMVEIGGPYSVKGLLANPICSPSYWKPSTFGGDVGFDIVKSATLGRLFCQNLKGACPPIAFTVPEETLGYSNEIKEEKTEL